MGFSPNAVGVSAFWQSKVCCRGQMSQRTGGRSHVEVTSTAGMGASCGTRRCLFDCHSGLFQWTRVDWSNKEVQHILEKEGCLHVWGMGCSERHVHSD